MEKPLDQLRIGSGRGLGEIFVVKIFDLKLSKHPYHIGYIQAARGFSTTVEARDGASYYFPKF